MVRGPSFVNCDHTCLPYTRCFFINLPTGGVALLLLFFFLNLNPHQHRKTAREHVKEFDFLGLFLLVVGTVLLLLGFNFSSDGGCESFSYPVSRLRYADCVSTLGAQAKCIAPIVLGVVCFIAAGINEAYTPRSPIFPPRLFKVRMVIIFVSASI